MITNVKLTWVAPYGPNKGKEVSAWFNYNDPDVKRLMHEYNAKIVKQV